MVRQTKLEAEHHQPRKIDKKKHHARGYTEEAQDRRQSRVGFKRYLQSLEEDLLDDELDDAPSAPAD